MNPMAAMSHSLAFVILLGASITGERIPRDEPSDPAVTRLYPTMAHQISDSEMAIVRRLFDVNHLSLENLRVAGFGAQRFTDLVPTAEPGVFYQVKCDQFVSGMEVFGQEVIYHFKVPARYDHQGGRRLDKLPLDTIPKVSIRDACTSFCKSIAADRSYADSLDEFMKRGFTAELGFRSLNSGSGPFALMWRLRVSGRVEEPESFIRADTLAVYWYWNGIYH
jgi:hypothetical protein